MQKKIFSLVIVLSFMMTLVVTSSAVPYAIRIRAEIPFDFMVGSKRLPKGEYLIESINDTGAISIRNAKKGKAVFFTAIKNKETEKPKSKLIFRRYGDQYFLARIWDGSDEMVWKIEKSKAEKKVAKAAQKEENPDEVPVADK
jgi:hypothetical protein